VTDMALAPGISLVLRPEVAVRLPTDGPATVEAPWARITLGDVGPGLRDALLLLSDEGAPEDALVDHVAEQDGPVALATLYYCLRSCTEHRFVCHAASMAGRRTITVVPMTSEPIGKPAHVDAAARCRLSRFAFARRGSGGLVIESPLAPVRVVLHGQQGGALLASLADPISADELRSVIAGSTLDEARAALGVLTAAGVLGAVDDGGTIAAEEAPTMRTWEFHDLLFHTRSRRGRNDLEYGGTYRFREQLPPLPALKPLTSNRITSLPRPEQDGAADSFTHVLEGRRSTREFAAAQLTADQLGELLYRASRVRAVLPAEDNRPYEITRRPYPGGGAAYELELYPLVHRCDGLSPALYHYDPGGHQLELIAGRSDLTDRLLSDAQWSSGTKEPPHVLVVVAARFGRVTWKYGAMAYALVLKDVGVLLQTMCLVATSMGIGACPLGGGDADLFAAAAGTDYYAETSVGELMVGTTS